MSRISQTVKQDQQFIMNFAMKRAFTVLQMPLIELSEWIYSELEQNPIFEVKSPHLSSDLAWAQKEDSLYEYLEKEINLYFTSPKERELARFIAGSLDSKGFLTLSHEELCKRFHLTPTELNDVLYLFHQIEPIGMGAQNVQEALCLQIIYQGREKSNLYQLISKHYDDLLHNRLDIIAKAMHLSIKAVKDLIQKELKSFNPFPAHRFTQYLERKIVADLTIDKEEGFWKVEVSEDFLPQFHIHPYYIKSLNENKLSKEEHHFICHHLKSEKWLIRILDRRKKILMAIGSYIMKKQVNFLEGIEETPLPLTRKKMAKALDLSESTITRAIYEKYVATPRGLFALNIFFTPSLETKRGIISNQVVKNLLLQIIQNENKKDPLSDQALSDALDAKGIPCARRTITKYRKELKIGARSQRKEWI